MYCLKLDVFLGTLPTNVIFGGSSISLFFNRCFLFKSVVFVHKYVVLVAHVYILFLQACMVFLLFLVA